MSLESALNVHEEVQADLIRLVERSKEGDRDAFGELIRRYQPLVHSEICKFLRWGLEDAPDIAQEVWMRAYQKIGQLDEPKAFPGWMRTMARNMAMSARMRSRRPFEELLNGYIDCRSRMPVDILMEREEQDRVHMALNNLREIYGRTLYLFYRDECSLKEIACILSDEEGRSIPIDTVKRRLHAGRKMAAATLKEAS